MDEKSCRPRGEKIVHALYPFFADIAKKANNDRHALIVCRRIRAHGKYALKTDEMREFCCYWERDYPEEGDIEIEEMLLQLKSFDEYISQQIKDIELNRTRRGSPNAMMKVIEGGLSADPDNPVLRPKVHKYTF